MSTETSVQAPDLDDDALVTAFRLGELDPASFDHAEHVRLGWACLERMPLLEVLKLFSEGLGHLSRRVGRPDLYHATVTWAFLFVIHERRTRTTIEDERTWRGFASRNPDLLSDGKAVLETLYRPETLRSQVARQTFVLPDRLSVA
ncbi:MAG: hypothetical protein AAGD38_07940 [Acidobacteriota bacterium]